MSNKKNIIPYALYSNAIYVNNKTFTISMLSIYGLLFFLEKIENPGILKNAGILIIIFNFLVIYYLHQKVQHLFSVTNINISSTITSVLIWAAAPLFWLISAVYVEQKLNYIFPIAITEIKHTLIAATLHLSFLLIIFSYYIFSTALTIYYVVKSNDIYRAIYVLTVTIKIGMFVLLVYTVYASFFTVLENIGRFHYIMLLSVISAYFTLAHMYKISLESKDVEWTTFKINSIKVNIIGFILIIVLLNIKGISIIPLSYIPLTKTYDLMNSSAENVFILRLAKQLDFKANHKCLKNEKVTTIISSSRNKNTLNSIGWTTAVIFMDENLAMRWNGKLKLIEISDSNPTYLELSNTQPTTTSLSFKNSSGIIISVDLNKLIVTQKNNVHQNKYVIPEFEVDTCVQTSK